MERVGAMTESTEDYPVNSIVRYYGKEYRVIGQYGNRIHLKPMFGQSVNYTLNICVDELDENRKERSE